MQLSMHNWMREEDIEITIERLARYGYESIEIGGEPDRYDVDEVKNLLNEYGVDCWGSVSLMMGGNRDLIHADEDVRANSVQYLKDCISMVEYLDGEVMTIVPSEVGKTDPMDTPEQEWQWAIEGLKEVYEYAQGTGVQICIEPLNRFETNFINRHDQALLLAEEVGPECGVCLDAFHINIEEADPMQAIRNVGDRLVDFHVADNNRMAPGQGSYDWEEVVNTLKSVGYDGALTVEFVPLVDRSPIDKYDETLEDFSPDEEEDEGEMQRFIKDHGGGNLSDELYSKLVEETAKTLRPYMD